MEQPLDQPLHHRLDQPEVHPHPHPHAHPHFQGVVAVDTHQHQHPHQHDEEHQHQHHPHPHSHSHHHEEEHQHAESEPAVGVGVGVDDGQEVGVGHLFAGHHLPLEADYLTNAQFVFSQEASHEEEVISYEGDAELDARKAELTKTFFLTFFEYPRNSTIWQYQVSVELVDFLYENVIPKRLRQRKQERSKYRLAELREAILANKDLHADKEEGDAAGLVDDKTAQLLKGDRSPPTTVVGGVGGVGVAGGPAAPGGRTPGSKRKAIELNKSDWIKKHNRKIYWVGMRGPLFPGNAAMFEKLQRLLGRALPNLSAHTFYGIWERQSKKPAVNKKSKTQVGVQQPSQFPLYDVWKDSEQEEHGSEKGKRSFVHFAFDLPGMTEEPRFTFSKASRRWQLEGSRPCPPGRKFAVHQRWHGKFCIYGTLPPSVDVSKTPRLHFDQGVLHVTLEEYLDE